MLGFKGPAQPLPALGDALNAGYRYLEVRYLGCDTHQIVALYIIWRAKDHADPRAKALHAMQGALSCPPVQAQPSSRAPTNQDQCKPSSNDLMARGARLTATSTNELLPPQIGRRERPATRP
jgi:hypothetical protein